MSAYIIATVTVKNTEKFQEYATKAKATFDLFDAEILVRGQYQGVLVGDVIHQSAAIIKFKDMETLDRWYLSNEYQALVALRNQAADITIAKYAVPEA